MSAALQEEGNGEGEYAQPAADIDQPGEDQGPQSAEQPANMNDDALYAIEVKEQDRWLPIANVARIMKTALPENAKIAKEAKECMQECVSEFISFITSEASEKCQQEKRKTVNGEDILFAMTSLGFENYSEALKIYLARYREAYASRTDNGAAQPRPGGQPSGGSAQDGEAIAGGTGAPGSEVDYYAKHDAGQGDKAAIAPNDVSNATASGDFSAPNNGDENLF